MTVKTFTKEPDDPGVSVMETGTEAHCRRVAAWCEELARHIKLPRDEAASLQEAALSHHQQSVLQGPSLSRLMGDLGLHADTAFDDRENRKSRLAERILLAFHNHRASPSEEQPARLARLLEAVNCFDEQLEYAPYDQDGIERVLEQATVAQHDSDGSVAFVLENLRLAGRDDLMRVLPSLPVYPAIAMRLYRLLGSTDVSLTTLETIAKADQVVAGKLLRAANSVFYSPWQPIKSVAQAISYVGMEDARRILLASSIQPLFATPRLRKLWRHALEAAQVAERIAELSGKVDPSEAFLLGLLHDVGKLAIALLSRDVNSAIDRLLEKGCQPATAELVLCGFDHAEAGSDVLRFWKFNEQQVAAVQYHHQPERSPSHMSAVLYLTEFWTDSEEDIPSNARLYTAMMTTGLTPEALDAARMAFNGAIANL